MLTCAHCNSTVRTGPCDRGGPAPPKPKGGYVSPYSCQALGLKKRSGSAASLVSSGSTELDSPLRRSPSKSGSRGNLDRSGSRNSVISKSSSKGSSVGGRNNIGTPAKRPSRVSVGNKPFSDVNKTNGMSTPRTTLTTPSPLGRNTTGMLRAESPSSTRLTSPIARRATSGHLRASPHNPRQRSSVVSSPTPALLSTPRSTDRPKRVSTTTRPGPSKNPSSAPARTTLSRTALSRRPAPSDTTPEPSRLPRNKPAASKQSSSDQK